jgi:hypothetical protein
MVLFRREKDGDILYFYLRNNRINLKAQAQNQSADYADYTDFKTKRLREIEAQSGNRERGSDQGK